MLSYTTRRNLFGQLANDSSAANLALADTLLNESLRQVISAKNWWFLQKTKTLVTSSGSNDLPSDFGKMLSLTSLVGSNTYTLQPINTRDAWDRLNYSTVTSSIPTYYFPFGNQVLLYPTPSSSMTLTYVYTRRQKDLTIADYTTGSIVSIANGGTAVVGIGTAWTEKMVGRWIRITDSDSANTGDGEWYQIESVTSTTTLTLDRLYGGSTISAGTASYVIAQVSLLPEPYHMLDIYKALIQYFTSIKPDQTKANLYADQFTQLMTQMKEQEPGQIAGPVLRTGNEDEYPPRNPNLYIRY